MSDFEAIRQKLLAQKSRERPTFAKGLSTGSTLLNLACSGRPEVGFLRGGYYFIVGDSASGKTFLSLTCLAEASINKRFKEYRFVYDNVEGGALMDIERFFGKETARRVASSEAGSSVTIEEFYFNLDDALIQGPCIYILDSMDALTTEEENEKFNERKQASRNRKQVAGSYGTSKAKANSAGIRRIITRLPETGSILIVISQTRDNIGFGAQFNPKTRSGGHALRFYASLEIWSSIKGRLKKTVNGKERQLGIICKAEVKKNRLTGRERTVEIPIYHSTGIDDLGSMVDYLIEEKYWVKSGAHVAAREFDFNGSRDKLIEQIEEKGSGDIVRKLVVKVWNDIETACEVKRRDKYH